MVLERPGYIVLKQGSKRSKRVFKEFSNIFSLLFEVQLYHEAFEQMQLYFQEAQIDLNDHEKPVFEVYRDDPVKLSAYLSICLIYKRYDLIEITINLFNLRTDNKYSKFIKINNILRKRLNFADRISRVSNHGIRFFVSDVDSTPMFY